MSKGPKIKDGVRWYISQQALVNRTEPRDSVSQRIEEYLEDKEPVPSRDTLNKMISSARNNPDPKDSPWSILTLTHHDIAAEALSTVFELWAYSLKEYKKPLTIREMKWAARLYRIIPNDKVSLLLSSIKYAGYEKSIEILGDKIALIAKEVGFTADTELYINTHMPKLTTEEILRVPEDPEILKRKRQNLLEELRSPEILKALGLENQADTAKRKGGTK